jgi:hypothetical protein
LSSSRRKKRGVWGWIAISALFAVIGLAAALEIMLHRAGPILRGRVIETLSTHFDSKVELDGFQVSVLKGLEVSGTVCVSFLPMRLSQPAPRHR